MTDWSTWKVVDLRAEAKNRGLPTKGVKAELVDRLTEADAAATQADESGADDKAATTEHGLPADDGPIEEVADAGAMATDSPPVTETNAIANSDATVPPEDGANVQPVASPEPTAIDGNAAQPDTAKKAASPIPQPSIDAAVDLQKRKRRSSTPPPSVKRARQEDERRTDEREDIVDFETDDIAANSQNAPQNGVENDVHIQEKSGDNAEGDPMQGVTSHPSVDGEDAPAALEVGGEESHANQVATAESSEAISTSQQPQVAPLDAGGQDEQLKPLVTSEQSSPPAKAEASALSVSGEDTFEHDAPAIPSIHPPTSGLYIRELMRPLRSEMVEQYILDLITPTGGEQDPSLIHEFYLDQIRTHAFVVLPSVSAAQRVRAALHNQIWPNESNRKSLFVDFVPPSLVKDFIDREESAQREGSRRWEVVYEDDGGAVVPVHREVDSSDRKPSFSRPPPTGPAAAGPVYPGIEAAPRGPRGRGGRTAFENPNALQTQTHPRLAYTPLNEEIARRRIDNMRSFYSRDPPIDLGKDYHRFTFENVDAFVDRGREVFIGIRPPHRQKEHEERLRRDRLGPAGPSSVTESRREDFRPPPRPPVTDEDRFSRHDGGRRPDWPPRNRGYRGDRGSRRFRGEDPYRYRPGY